MNSKYRSVLFLVERRSPLLATLRTFYTSHLFHILCVRNKLISKVRLARVPTLAGTGESEDLHMVRINKTARTYQPINSYGVIGDCRTAVLIAPDGSVDWACLPDFDSPAIFCRLLDAERGGYFQVAPSDASIPGAQHYLSGSNILQTRFTSLFGEISLTDFMPVETLSALPLQEMKGTTGAGQENAHYSLIRIVECTRGELPVTMTLKASPQYAAASSTAYLVSQSTGAVVSGGEQHLGLAILGTHQLPSFTLTVEQGAEDMNPTLIAQATLQKGDRLLFAMGMAST